MLPEEALAAAEAEGLTLLRSDTATGYWAVRQQGKRFSANASIPGKNNKLYLGCFDSCAEEAALAIARRIPNAAETLAAQAARKEKKRTRQAEPELSHDEVKAIAAEESLTLLYDSQNKTGFRGVYKSDEPKHRAAPFRAKILGKKHTQSVGCYPTAHEATLAIARKLGPGKSAKVAAEPARSSGGWVITAERTMDAAEATHLAKEEGLTLRRARHRSGFWNIRRASERADGSVPWIAYVRGPDSVVPIHLGTFACAEAAALAIARRLRDDAKLGAYVAAAHATPHPVVEVETVVVEAWSDDEDDIEAAIVVESVCAE